MQSFLDTYGYIATWLGIISGFTFFLSLLLIPLFINRLDSNFFLHLHKNKKKKNKHEHPLMFMLLRILRYSVGVFLISAGILMLFLPGQGLLTIIIGIALLDFPAKRALTGRILSCQKIQKSLNWIREKGAKSPFTFP